MILLINIDSNEDPLAKSQSFARLNRIVSDDKENRL